MIQVLSQARAVEMVKQGRTEINLISMVDFNHTYPQFPNCERVLHIRFNDVLTDQWCAPQLIHIKHIVDFIKEKKNRLDWVVTCPGGVSRSAAVGLMVCSILERADPMEYFQNYREKICPNKRVLELYKELTGVDLVTIGEQFVEWKVQERVVL